MVSVRDYGSGLPKDDLDKVFTHFYSTKPNGMGMGLTIVRSIVEAHGGKLNAENVDEGARFFFRLPMWQKLKRRRSHEREPRSLSAWWTTTSRCVADCGVYLNPRGMPRKLLPQPKIISRGKSSKARSALFSMSGCLGLNGLGLQEALESRGACEQIVFITGHGDVPTCTQAMKNGAVDFLIEAFRRRGTDRSGQARFGTWSRNNCANAGEDARRAASSIN